MPAFVSKAMHAGQQLLCSCQQLSLLLLPACLCAQAAAGDKRTGATDDTQLLAASQQWASKCLPQFLAALGQHGWQLDKLYLPRPQYTAEW